MSEDIGNVEADLEVLMAALELAGILADRARRDALRLARHVRQDPPRSREEWANRAQLTDRDGRDLGWLDTSKARRIDLVDATGAGDRNVAKHQPAAAVREQQGPRQLVEVEGQFFEVSPGAGKGAPEQVRPISLEDAQARLSEHRPDLSTRMVGTSDPRLEVTRGTDAAAVSAERARALIDDAGQAAKTTAETTGRLPATSPAAAATSSGVAGPARSAAEVFGAIAEPAARGRGAESQAAAAAPSTAELTAVGATKPAGAGVSR